MSLLAHAEADRHRGRLSGDPRVPVFMNALRNRAAEQRATDWTVAPSTGATLGRRVPRPTSRPDPGKATNEKPR